MNKLDHPRSNRPASLRGAIDPRCYPLTGCSKNTVAKLLVSAVTPAPPVKTGPAQPAVQARSDGRNLELRLRQGRERGEAKAAPAAAGDVWTWTAICADTKLIVSWPLGVRDMDVALAFVSDLRGRLAKRV